MNIVKIRIFSFHLQKSGNIDKFKLIRDKHLIFKFRNLLNWKMYIYVSRFEVKKNEMLCTGASIISDSASFAAATGTNAGRNSGHVLLDP